MSPLTVDEANAVLDWAEEYGIRTKATGADVTASHPGSPVRNGVPHVHIDGAGGAGHVPVAPGVLPR